MAHDVRFEFPLASEIISKSMYVDDVVGGAHSPSEGIDKYHEFKKAFGSAKMNLRKWCTNSSELRAIIPESDLEIKACSANVRALGISWSAITDQFTYEVKIK